jgi:hypothetical protein
VDTVQRLNDSNTWHSVIRIMYRFKRLDNQNVCYKSPHSLLNWIFLRSFHSSVTRKTHHHTFNLQQHYCETSCTWVCVNARCSTSHTVAARHTLSQHVTHCRSTSQTVAACHILSQHVTYFRSMSHTVAARHILLQHVTYWPTVCCSTTHTVAACHILTHPVSTC